MTAPSVAAPATSVTSGVSAPGRPRPVTPLGILTARLEEVRDLLDERGHDDPRVREGVAEALVLAAGLDPYLEQHAGPESPALRALAEQTAAHDWVTHPARRWTGREAAPLEQEMLSGHVEGRLLALLVRAVRARRVLEIGMFTGYSALALAEALPADGVVVACEIDPEAAAMASRFFADSPVGDRIEIRLGPALETLGQLGDDGQSFDLVFVDADKAGYLGYLHAVLGRGLLVPGGLICVDNTLMQGQPWSSGARTANGDAVAAFNQVVADDPELEQVIIPLRDGLTLIRRTQD